MLDRWENDRERHLLAHILEIEPIGGCGVTGLRKCLWAATSKAIDTLLLRDADEAAAWSATSCGWLGESGDVCPVSGNQLRHAHDIVDQLVQSVLRDGGEVRMLEEGIAPEGRTPAAYLRFPLPPQPGA